jgi:hypothetical protein
MQGMEQDETWEKSKIYLKCEKLISGLCTQDEEKSMDTMMICPATVTFSKHSVFKNYQQFKGTFLD